MEIHLYGVVITFKSLVMIALLYVIMLLINIGDAVSDAYIDVYKKRSHILEVSVIVLYFLLVHFFSISDANILQLISIYVCIRIYAFNIAYNITRSLPIYYRGETDKIWDRWLRNISTPVYRTLIMVCAFFSIVFCFIF